MDTERLVADVVRDLDLAVIRPPEIVVSTGKLRVAGDGDRLDALLVGEAHGAYRTARDGPVNVVALMADLMGRTTPPMQLTRRTVLEIIRRSSRRADASRNPHEFAAIAVRIIKSRLTDQLVDGIRYERLDDWYRMEQFETDIETWREYLVPAERCLYDNVAFDSEIERRFAEELDRREDVALYVKLPGWFTGSTPIGEYNPDWAVVIEPRDEFGDSTGDEKLYLVSETKGTTDLGKLRPDEARKIRCGRRHFEDTLGVPYRVVAAAAELP